MVGLMVFLALTSLIFTDYLRFNVLIHSLKATKADEAVYFYDFIKNHYNAFLGVGVSLPQRATVRDLKSSGVLDRTFPEDFNFVAETRPSPCNNRVFDVVYYASSNADLRDFLMKQDWKDIEKTSTDVCNSSLPAVKIDYAVNGRTLSYNLRVNPSYRGTVVIVSAPMQTGYLVFRFKFIDQFSLTIVCERGICWTPYTWQSTMQFAGFTRECPEGGIDVDKQDLFVFYGSSQVSGIFPQDSIVCIPALRSDFVPNPLRSANTTSGPGYNINDYGIDLSDVANYFVVDDTIAPNNIPSLPFYLRTYASIIKSSLTGNYYIIFSGYTVSLTGSWNKTRNYNGHNYPAFSFDQNLGQRAYHSYIRLATKLKPGEVKTFITNFNNFSGGEGMIHILNVSPQQILWNAGYYDKYGNKRDNGNGKQINVIYYKNF